MPRSQQAHAWNFNFEESVDLITSNGLNIYEHDDQRVIDLYEQFFHNLKPGGVLLTSFVTPPPQLDANSEWDLTQVNSEDAFLQKIIFSDILGVSWQAFRSSELTKEQLEKAGFVEIKFIPDRAHLFPTVVAHRPKFN